MHEHEHVAQGPKAVNLDFLTFFNLLTLNQAGFFGCHRGGGGSYVPTDKQSTAEAKIFILHHQSASHMKGVMFSVYLVPW